MESHAVVIVMIFLASKEIHALNVFLATAGKRGRGVVTFNSDSSESNATVPADNCSRAYMEIMRSQFGCIEGSLNYCSPWYSNLSEVGILHEDLDYYVKKVSLSVSAGLFF